MIRRILEAKGAHVHAISPELTLQEAASELVNYRIGATPVVDQAGNLCGMLSERDIVRATALGGAPALAKRVAEVMTVQVVTATPEDTVDECLARMTNRRIRHLPIVVDGALIGIVSIGDLVKRKIEQALSEADAIRDYITR